MRDIEAEVLMRYADIAIKDIRRMKAQQQPIVREFMLTTEPPCCWIMPDFVRIVLTLARVPSVTLCFEVDCA